MFILENKNSHCFFPPKPDEPELSLNLNQNQNRVYCQAGLHIQGICIGVLHINNSRITKTAPVDIFHCGP